MYLCFLWTYKVIELITDIKNNIKELRSFIYFYLLEYSTFTTCIAKTFNNIKKGSTLFRSSTML